MYFSFKPLPTPLLPPPPPPPPTSPPPPSTPTPLPSLSLPPPPPWSEATPTLSSDLFHSPSQVSLRLVVQGGLKFVCRGTLNILGNLKVQFFHNFRTKLKFCELVQNGAFYLIVSHRNLAKIAKYCAH